MVKKFFKEKSGSILLFSTLFLFLLIQVNNYIFIDSETRITNLADILLKIGNIVSPIMLILVILLVLYKKELTNIRLGRLSLILIAYQLGNILWICTQNLNNKDFELTYQVISDNFFNKNVVGIVLVILISLVLNLIFSRYIYAKSSLKDRISQRVSSIRFSGISIEVAFLTTLIFTNDRFFEYYKTYLTFVENMYIAVRKPLEFISTQDLLLYSLDLFLIFLFIWIICKILIKGFESLLKGRPTPYLAGGSSLLLAFIFNYIIQKGIVAYVTVGDEFVYQQGILFQILILSLIFNLLYLLINRYIYATGFIIIASIIFSVSNSIKFSMRTEPILPSEVSWLKNIPALISFIDFKSILPLLVVVPITVCFLIYLQKKVYIGKIYTKNYVRFIYTMCVILAFFIISYPLTSKSKNSEKDIKIPLVSQFYKWNDANILWQGNVYLSNVKSLSYVWLKQIYSDVMEEPNSYNQKTMENIVKKYSKESKIINKNRHAAINDQTVIFVLSESLSNPKRLSGIELSETPLSYIDSLGDKTTKGLMQSDGYGGGTANMEYQTLTGLSKEYFNPYVSVLYNEVVPGMEFIPSISDYFDDKIAIHLENAGNYQRDIIYNKLKFDKFIANTGTDNKPTGEIERVNDKASDKTTYNQVLENMNDKSQFFSVISMQNHAGYNDESQGISASGQEFDDGQNRSLQNYSNLLKVTDDATKDFLDELSKVDKKVTVVFYGDHLPGFYPDSAFGDNMNLKFETDYFIWSNYQDKKLDYPKVRSNNFIAELFEHTDSKVSPWYALQTELLQNIEGKEESELTKEEKEILSDFKLVQYDLTSGKNYLKKDDKFFKVPSK